MNGDPTRTRVIFAQGLAALAYFFCIHGAHAATVATHAKTPAHAPAASIQSRPA
jgi:hypothetical protein